MSQDRPDSDLPRPVGDGEGQSSTRIGELDMRNVGDRSKLAEAIRRNWPAIVARVPRYLAALDAVIREADPSDPAGAKAIAQCNAIIERYHGQALKDVHKGEDEAAIAAGKPTSRVEVVTKAPPDYDALRRRMLEAHRPNPN